MLLINEHHWIVNGASDFITYHAHMYHLIKFPATTCKLQLVLVKSCGLDTSN